jgi:S-adenosylmethionine:tRNA ribosyltransferase-isomerase
VTGLRTDDFDYILPPDRIAQHPVEPRDASRLLVIQRHSGQLEHRHFREIGGYLRPGDLLIANDSRVLPGRLWARRSTGGRVEFLLLRQLDGDWWEALARPAHRLRQGEGLELLPTPETAGEGDGGGSAAGGGGTPLREAARSAAGDGGRSAAGSPLPVGEGTYTVEVGPRTESGGLQVRFSAPVEEVVARFGNVPLPPYIRAPLADPERYQTVYSRVTGSAAAPTAGLHFTPALLDALAAGGIAFAFVTLHVGPDTFRPVRTARIVEHEMHAEFIAVPDETARAIAAAKREGRRVIAVGTTAVRALESWAREVAIDPEPPGWSGWTRLFIYPGFQFRVVDALITNFHLPRSTLLMLVSAFASRDLILRAYQEAIAQDYRFYSFGDATLIL